MSAYATAADDIQPRVAIYLTLSTGSVPTTAQVGRWIDETSAKVDAYLKRAGYTLPIAGANDLVMLRGLVADKVALQALYIGLGAENVPQSTIDALAGFGDFLKMLKDGDAVLIDQNPSTVGNILTTQAAVYGRESINRVLFPRRYYGGDDDL